LYIASTGFQYIFEKLNECGGRERHVLHEKLSLINYCFYSTYEESDHMNVPHGKYHDFLSLHCVKRGGNTKENVYV
jgi:hypothetical protein